MSKFVLINEIEVGRICDVVDAGEQYEVHTSFQWIECADDAVTHHWVWSMDSTGKYVFSFTPIHLDPSFAAIGYSTARQIAYKSIGEQLSMLHDELNSTGTISKDGPWSQHIIAAKAAIPKNDPQAVLDWYAAANAPT